MDITPTIPIDNPTVATNDPPAPSIENPTGSGIPQYSVPPITAPASGGNQLLWLVVGVAIVALLGMDD